MVRVYTRDLHESKKNTRFWDTYGKSEALTDVSFGPSSKVKYFLDHSQNDIFVFLINIRSGMFFLH